MHRKASVTSPSHPRQAVKTLRGKDGSSQYDTATACGLGVLYLLLCMFLHVTQREEHVRYFFRHACKLENPTVEIRSNTCWGVSTQTHFHSSTHRCSFTCGENQDETLRRTNTLERRRMDWIIMSQRYSTPLDLIQASINSKSVESILSSYRNLHTHVTWGWTLWCTRKNLGKNVARPT